MKKREIRKIGLYELMKKREIRKIGLYDKNIIKNNKILENMKKI